MQSICQSVYVLVSWSNFHVKSNPFHGIVYALLNSIGFTVCKNHEFNWMRVSHLTVLRKYNEMIIAFKYFLFKYIETTKHMELKGDLSARPHRQHDRFIQLRYLFFFFQKKLIIQFACDTMLRLIRTNYKLFHTHSIHLWYEIVCVWVSACVGIIALCLSIFMWDNKILQNGQSKIITIEIEREWAKEGDSLWSCVNTKQYSNR